MSVLRVLLVCLVATAVLAADVESSVEAEVDVEADKPKKSKLKPVLTLKPKMYGKNAFMKVVIVPKGDPRARGPAPGAEFNHPHSVHHRPDGRRGEAFAPLHKRVVSALFPKAARRAPQPSGKHTSGRRRFPIRGPKPVKPSTPSTPTPAPILKAGAPVTSTACANAFGVCSSSCTDGGVVVHGLCAGPASITCCTHKPKPTPTPTPTPSPSAGSPCMNAAGINMVKSFEGFSATFYRDSVGVLTIGYGHACQPDSACKNIHAPITQAAAASMLSSELTSKYGKCVRAIPGLNNNQYSALTSFVYNLGCGVLKGTLLSNLKAHNFSAAANEMLQYDHAGGKVLAGLLRRRKAEAALLLKAPSGNDNVCFK